MKSIVIQSPQEDELYGFKVHNFSLYVGESINEIYLFTRMVCLSVSPYTYLMIDIPTDQTPLALTVTRVKTK